MSRKYPFSNTTFWHRQLLLPLLLQPLLLLLLFCAPSNTTRFPDRNGIPIRLKLFNLTAESPEKSRLAVVASVEYEKLQFLKQGDRYSGEYLLSLEITDKAKKLVEVKDLTVKINLEDYRDTVKNNPIYNWLGFYDLEPKLYKIKIKLVDSHSRSQGQILSEVTLKNFNEKPLTPSHVIFTKKRLIDLPNWENVILDFSGTTPDSLFAYMELIQKNPVNTQIKIRYEIKDPFNVVLQAHAGIVNLSEWRSTIFLPLNVQKLSAGLNQLNINYEFQGETATVETKFYVNWSTDQLRSEENIDLTLRQLRFIASGKDIRRIEKAPMAQQDSLLKDYWKQRDPTPETEENELYQEFVNRVQEAVKMFSFQRDDGWRTDRGVIYLKYGPPEVVEKDIPSRTGFGRYEIWTYEELRRRFVFYDRMGIGEYRLVSQQ